LNPTGDLGNLQEKSLFKKRSGWVGTSDRLQPDTPNFQSAIEKMKIKCLKYLKSKITSM